MILLQDQLQYIPRFFGLQLVEMRPKNVVLFPEIGQLKIFLSFALPRSQMCIKIYVLCFKKTHTQRKSKRN